MHIWDWASIEHSQELVDNILKGFFTVNIQTPIKNKTPLHFAVEFRCVKNIHKLMMLGADPELGDY